MERLRELLRRIDGKGYKAYKALEGDYRYPGFRLVVDHVQGDPFADPSRLRVALSADEAGFPEALSHNRIRRTALEDYLGRAFAAAIRRHVKGRRGSGKSGQITIAPHGQQVLRRNAVLVRDGGVEARFQLALPAAGRGVLGREAEAMLFDELPALIDAALRHAHLDSHRLADHVDSVEDQVFLRRWLSEEGLVAFIADGARLPRRSGVDDRPMGDDAIPFRTPRSLAREVALPHAGTIRGMAIPAGVTLIVGGGFHGKSTLLHALERGVYDHIPSDGRERVATLASAVKIRAEDGRAISAVDISPFIDHLPLGRDTHRFTTPNASGSTSQAANIVEAVAGGCELLLIDEDTSATNFMIRDARMQALVAKEKEPITPLSHRIRELFDTHGISTIVVMGGSGDYFSEADTVLMLDAYQALDVTREAKALATPLSREGAESAAPLTREAPPRRPTGLDPHRRDGKLKILAPEPGRLVYGEHEIDLGRVEQLIDRGQTLAIGHLIRRYVEHYAPKGIDLMEGMGLALEEVERDGLDLLPPYIQGRLALPRLHEALATVNRVRDLRLIDNP